MPGPAANCDEAQKARLESFARTLQGVSFNASEFKAILDEVRGS
jgi:hypothetical protein